MFCRPIAVYVVRLSGQGHYYSNLRLHDAVRTLLHYTEKWILPTVEEPELTNIILTLDGRILDWDHTLQQAGVTSGCWITAILEESDLPSLCSSSD